MILFSFLELGCFCDVICFRLFWKGQEKENNKVFQGLEVCQVPWKKKRDEMIQDRGLEIKIKDKERGLLF